MKGDIEISFSYTVNKYKCLHWLLYILTISIRKEDRKILEGVLTSFGTLTSYVTRIRPGRRVSRIRYVSDTDTCPIRQGYVSSEYPNFNNFREYWIRGLIRIGLMGYGPAQ